MEILDTQSQGLSRGLPPLAPLKPKTEPLEIEDMSEFEFVRELGSGAYGKVFSIKSGSEYRALKVQEFF